MEDALFYNYDIFLKSQDIFKPLIEKADTFENCLFYVASQIKEYKGCLIWSFEKELHGDFNFTELKNMIPGSGFIDFLFDFETSPTDTAIFMNTLPLKNLFVKRHPYYACAAVFDRDRTAFSFNGKISFWCGMIINNKFRAEIMQIPHIYYPDKIHKLIVSSGTYTIQNNTEGRYLRCLLQKFINDNMRQI